MAQHEQLFCSLDGEGGPGMGGDGPPSFESFHPGRSANASGGGSTFRAGDGRTHFNLLGWNGRGDAPHLFPEVGDP
jgi:nitrate reductase beta subunit